jgi:hypothetical protein
MEAETQETKLENLRISSDAKARVIAVVDAIHADMKVRPTLAEAITIMADHYLNTGRNPLAA